jgi:HK97 family phage major capsid protein
MTRLEKLQADFRAIEAKAKPLAEKESLTEAEGVELNGYLDQIEAKKREIDQANRALAALSSSPADRVEVVQDEADKPFASLGEELQAIAIAGMEPGDRIAGKATGTVDPRLRSRIRAASGMNEATPAEGGFLVGTEQSTALIQKAYAMADLASRCNRVPIGAGFNGLSAPFIKETSRATGSRLGGVRVYRKNEGAAATAAAPEFGLLDIKLEDMIGLCYATNDLIQDASALGAIIERSFAQEFSFKLDDEIVEGTGNGQCLGITKAAALVTVDAEGGQTADTIKMANIDKMWAALWNPSRGRAVWLINQEDLPQLSALQYPGGAPAYMPAGGLSGSPFGTLKGRPVIEIEQASALGDKGDIILVDLGEYVLIDKGGVQAAQSLHVKFTTNEMAFRWVYRVNGQPAWATALTPFKGKSGATVSPFVTLAARA